MSNDPNSTASMTVEQRADKLVREDVMCCCSALIQELSTNEKYWEELREIQSKEDWHEPAYWHINNEMDADELQTFLEDECDEEGEETDLEDMQSAAVAHIDEISDSDVQVFCEERSVEPYVIEAYEHWIVTDWLARKLEGEGEMVDRDIYGLTVWGRATSGQMISMDSVIQKIAKDLL